MRKITIYRVKYSISLQGGCSWYRNQAKTSSGRDQALSPILGIKTSFLSSVSYLIHTAPHYHESSAQFQSRYANPLTLNDVKVRDNRAQFPQKVDSLVQLFFSHILKLCFSLIFLNSVFLIHNTFCSVDSLAILTDAPPLVYCKWREPLHRKDK